MMIIDTREQKPLWSSKKLKVMFRKLDEGDYTTSELLNKAHAERKSSIDLYGSLIQGHKRFVAEIQRAIEKDLSFAVFVECTEEVFVSMRFDGAHRLQVKPEVLKKIVETFMDHYPIEFFWCEDRSDLRDKMCLWFVDELEKIKNA